MIELWTRMTPEFYDVLLQNGVIRGSEEYVWEEFAEAYKWMIEQMTQRIPGFTGGYPIWAWVREEDCDWQGMRHQQLDRVVIHWQAPRDQVLLSDFDGWHAVTNAHFLSRNEAEEAAWDTELEQRGISFHEAAHSALPTDIQTRIETSWQRVFDGWDEIDGRWYGKEVSIQAVIPELRLEQVIAVYDSRELYERNYRRQRKHSRLNRTKRLTNRPKPDYEN
jgi:hypothetical protein